MRDILAEKIDAAKYYFEEHGRAIAAGLVIVGLSAALVYEKSTDAESPQRASYVSAGATASSEEAPNSLVLNETTELTQSTDLSGEIVPPSSSLPSSELTPTENATPLAAQNRQPQLTIADNKTPTDETSPSSTNHAAPTTDETASTATTSLPDVTESSVSTTIVVTSTETTVQSTTTVPRSSTTAAPTTLPPTTTTQPQPRADCHFSLASQANAIRVVEGSATLSHGNDAVSFSAGSYVDLSTVPSASSAAYNQSPSYAGTWADWATGMRLPAGSLVQIFNDVPGSGQNYSC